MSAKRNFTCLQCRKDYPIQLKCSYGANEFCSDYCIKAFRIESGARQLTSKKVKIIGNREDHIDFMFDEINDWIYEDKNASRFDATFFEQIEVQWHERGELSDKQYQALQNIYDKWVVRSESIN